MLSRVTHVARTLQTQAANYLQASATAAAAEQRNPLPDAPVAVFYAGGPVELYQLVDWLPVLEHLDRTVPLVVVCTRADGARAVMGATDLPVRLAMGAPDLEALVAAGVRAVLYVNHLERNFRMLRFAGPVHIYLGHGESDKDSSVSNQNKAYDRVFVAGQAGRDRLSGALRGFDATTLAPMVGRTQLDHARAGAPEWPRDDRVRVLYAPTWEGDRPSMSYGSLPTHGVALVRSLLRDGGFRVIYRPHPRSGTVSPAHRRADGEIRALLADTDHLVDVSDYGWQPAFADVCITDVSSVAYDWLATGKPLLVTQPANDLASVPPTAFLELAPRLHVEQAPDAVSVVRSVMTGMPSGWGELVEHYFGDVSPGAATERFESAIVAALSS